MKTRTKLFLLPFLLALMLPQTMTADNNENASLYLVTMGGIDQLKFEMPVYDEDDYDGWVDDGYVYVTPSGGSRQTLLRYYTSEKSGSRPTVYFSKGVDGAMVLKRDQDYSDITVTTYLQSCELPNVPDQEYFKMYLTWTVPDNLRGKELTISWKVHKTGNMTEWSEDVTINSTKVTFPATPDLIQPSLMDPMLGYDANHAGQTMIIYSIGANNIQNLTLYYTEVNGKKQTKRQTLVDPEMSGFIYLDADKCYKDVYLQAKYVDTEKKVRISQSDTIVVPTLHLPYGLSAAMQADGSVNLTWSCKNNQWNDIMSNDTWEVQRNTTGALNAAANWQSVGAVSFLNKDTIYTCTDNSLVGSYEGQPVYYRVRRASTGAWDWQTGTYSQTWLPYVMKLPTVTEASASRGTWTDDNHVANLTFKLGNPKTDSDGRFVLSTVADWEELAKMVNTGADPGRHVIMAADIDLRNCQTRIGTNEHPFEGDFYGNGHTLTVHFRDSVNQSVAPFAYTGGRAKTFSDLHVAGTIYTTKKYAGGIVGSATTGPTFQNCRSSVSFTCNMEGDASCGGIVGHVSGTRPELYNCLFDGEFHGSKAHSFGGLVGWYYNVLNVYNCLFAPNSIDISPGLTSCETFARDGNAVFDYNSAYITPLYRSSTYSDGTRTYTALYTADDWNNFVSEIVAANGTREVNAIMMNDFDVTEPAGFRSDIPFYGVFNGNGHTLGVRIQGQDASYAAPFSHTKNATIQNLIVRGSVKGGIHSSGLVGSSEGSTLLVENCQVSVDVYTTSTHAGGIIGHGHSVKNTVRNCLFDGSITAQKFGTNTYAGAIFGWEDGGTSNVNQNNLEYGTYVNINHAGMNYCHNGSGNGTAYGATNNWNTHNWGECNKVGDLSAAELAEKLGDNNWETFGKTAVPKHSTIVAGQGTDMSEASEAELLAYMSQGKGAGNWQIVGNSVVPVMKTSDKAEHAATVWDERAQLVLYTDKSVNGELRYADRRVLTKEERKSGNLNHELVTSCVDHDFRFTVEQGSSRLTPIDTIGTKVKKTETGELARYEYNSNVQLDSLKANTKQSSVALEWKTTGTGDFFRIIRRDKATDEELVLEDNYTQTTYIDKKPRPQHVYIYTVQGVNNCEGEHVSSLSIEGWCEPTGMVRGYVRLTDGTALADVRVKATPQGDTKGQVVADTTDATGFYEIKGLEYTGSGTYLITAESAGDEGAFTEYYANFDENSNMVTNANLVQDKYYLLSGYVMYEGTSVPVIGAQFERDGQIVHNGSGKPVITDSQGRFKISVPQGPHTICVVKDGHVFAENGYYRNEEGDSTVSWQKSVYDHVFWDKTRVTLQGRVVGGDVQGGKPLGELASVNNLGDSLTIVMQLEGDNASWLVRDQLNASITERHTDYHFGTNQKDSCHMDTYRYRLVIKPNPTTGEYCVPMLPVKYKVTEIYAEGYPTLFQTGKVGETLDLSDHVNKDTISYSRIYHSTPTLTVQQFNMIGGDYMGIASYTSMDNTGKKTDIELWNDSTGYSFGHPVFMAGSSVIMMLSAVEQYYYNNDVRQRVPDIIHLPGGEVRINNALIGTDKTETVKLDSLGEATYRFTPQNLTFTEENDLALKTLTMTLFYDGTYYDVLPFDGQPIRGYVMASTAKSQGRRAVDTGSAVLLDILRDPPGAGSSAYIETGSKLNYTFSENLKVQLGAKLTFGKSSGKKNMWQGVWAGEFSGEVVGGNTMSVSTKDYLSMSFVATYYNSWQYGYTFETTERISTSSSNLNVGRDADVFIGMTQSHVMEDGIAVRAIDEATYNLLTTHAGGTYTIDDIDFNVPQGTMKLIAEGQDKKGRKVYLVRDEVLTYRTELLSTFVHSQTYIEKELIPELFNLRNTLILPMGTSVETAKSVAGQKGCAMYISKVPLDDEHFGQKDYYTQVDPDEKSYRDSVAVLNSRINTWISFLATNEREKLEARDLVKRYEVDGRSSVTYSESFGTSQTESRYFQLPLVGSAFGNISFGPGMTGTSTGGGGTSTGTTQSTSAVGDDLGSIEMDFEIFNVGVYSKITPVLSFDYNYNYGKSESHSKKVGFTLAPSNKSNLIVDVYRTTMDKSILDASVDSLVAMSAAEKKEKAQDYIFQYTTDTYLQFVKQGGEWGKDYGPLGSLGGLWSYVSDIPTQYRSLVYRTRGGATNQPYEDERKTKYYADGVLLDTKTIEIDRPRIWADQASVSNVPYDEPARFTIHMANESEMPAQCTEVFTYMLSDIANVKGAKITVDGNPLAGEGHSVMIPAGQVVTKQVEIYPGADFDYDNLVIQLYDPNDKKRVYSCNLSAHFVPTAGKVNISLPGDKWVVNTESQYDNDRQQYYMPVRIDGFDVNYRNFDHIELQYKLSTQGDKDWVNVCSYYKSDSLMAKATGECKLIENDGHIIATFWGETDPIEQQYDLRAVNYCRYGDGFLTRSSNILSGVKDTRRPQLFGTPKPENGILDIGGDILLRFSEPIAGNYLRELNNFQVLGQTNNNNMSLSTCLDLEAGDEVVSMSPRNLAGKSFTVDVMLKPDKENREMIFFSHGSGSDKLELGLTADRRLTATFHAPDSVGEKVDRFTSTAPVDFSVLHQVQFVFTCNIEDKSTTVGFYDGSKEIGTYNYNRIYIGQGRYYLGTRIHEVESTPTAYSGDMLEFRLWNRALTAGEMDLYKLKRLTGYELGLMDNFPLNEGKGKFSYNRVNSGGDLRIEMGSWKVPDGIGMELDGEKGFRIDSQKFSRSDYHDYTLMFWFRTTDSEGTLLGNGRAETEKGAKSHFNFGVHGGDLDLKLSGCDLQTTTKVNDGQWHHAALSVSRSRNVGNLYIDQALKKTFVVDTLGGISGNFLAAGATYLDATTVERPIKGHIDEIAMYEMALSENIIKAIATMTPSGKELGLKAYLNFAQNELQTDNSQRLVPTGVSLKRYVDGTTGEVTTQRDTLVAQDVIDRLADKESYAPMRGLAGLENIKYSYVADGKDLLINLDVPDYAVEKTNVMVTVKDIADLNGNTLASPVTMDLYVYRNPLRWDAKQLNLTADYGEGASFMATVQNLSGRTKRFTIEGLPVWITASQYEGVISALGEVPITFNISPYINIGDFDEIIYIVGEDGMSEPLPITLKVRGMKPDWAVDEGLLRANISMSIVGQVDISGEVAHDKEDMLAAFDEDHRLMGVAHPDADVAGAVNEGVIYLNVYNTDYSRKRLYFEFYDASTGTIHKVIPEIYDAYFTFKNDTIVGSAADPVPFTANNGVVQVIQLKKGWNWVSFNVAPMKAPVKQLLNNATQWQVGDGLEADKEDGSHYLITYKAVANPKDPKSVNYLWDYGDSILTLDQRLMYRFYSNNDKLAYVAGFSDYNSITVKKGWNRIGFISDLNLPLGTALAEYTDKGSHGDIIKSQSEFAMLTVDASGNKQWKGTLNFLRVGEGYMLKRNADNEVTFRYPEYYTSSRYSGLALSMQAPVFRNTSGTSMTVVAMAEGVEVQPGDRITAYRGAEVCGISQADSLGVFYLNVGGADVVTDELTFTLERDDELIAVTTKAQMSYRQDAALGTPDEPTAISFSSADNLDTDGWYTLSGVKLAKKPRQQGVFIHNNQKVIIK